LGDEIINITIQPGTTSIRLDKFISEQHPEISRTQAQRLIDEGLVRINGTTARSSYKITASDQISITIPPPTPSTLLPEDIPLKIIYEDNDVIVVDKPAGLTVHPAPGHPEHTLANAILSRLPAIADTGERRRPGIVHRLDKDTSGLIIIAKNNQAHQKLTEQFKARTVKKIYLTLVRGKVTPDRGTIEAPIGRDRSHREKMAITDRNHGREARTKYRVLKHIGNYSLLEAIPETGRTHQIRVHLAAIGYPVIGDKVYGVKSPLLNRQFLHAQRIKFQLPSSGKEVEFSSELPTDLTGVLQALEQVPE
jgi:23S rRNA pseudouridine1911/1915/1917 synthase